MSDSFTSFLSSIEPSNRFLVEAIRAGYDVLFDGVNDIHKSVDINTIITKIRNKFAYNMPKFGSMVDIRPEGFEYRDTEAGLNVRFVYNGEFLPHYNIENNYIFIPFDDAHVIYDGSTKSILKLLSILHDTLSHELRHWLDHQEFDLNKHRYTRLSQIENNELNDLKASVSALTNEQYINQRTEINAIISEFIEFVLNIVFNKKKIYTFKEMMVIFNKEVTIDELTIDMKKRLYKRLYVFWNALTKLSDIKDKTTDELREELISVIMKSNSKFESIEYTHIDIVNKKSIVFFEANYKLDSDYRSWFANKYIRDGRCLITNLSDAINSNYEHI